MSGVSAYPLQWPANRPREKFRRASKFKVTLGRARDDLLNELHLLKATQVVLSSNLKLRNDGLPLANQSAPQDPGVAVYFLHKGRQVCFACDRWDRVEDNMHAVELTIAALRGIGRWGTGDMVNAAFTGFAALPPAGRPWRSVLGVTDVANAEYAYMRLAKRCHPDTGGSEAAMKDLNQAIEEARRELGGSQG